MTNKLFTDFAFVPEIQNAIKKTGYESPTPIQAATIPHLLLNKDLIGCAQTGTGKTAAFALPLLNKLATRKKNVTSKNVHSLILTPTRELAVQIHENFKIYGLGLNLKIALAYGGVSIGPQIRQLHDGVDVLIATPGRLLDVLHQNKLTLKMVETFILDEADRMLDMGFINDIKKIISTLPRQRQTILFSATMPSEIEKLAQTMLNEPIRVDVAPPATTAEKIAQSVMFVETAQKRELLKYLLDKPEFKRVIVFTRTKHGANKVAEVLNKNKIKCDAIHGNKSQNARQRSLENLKAGSIQVLIATDVAARGIDIDHITHVINYDVPNISESYVHRIGRTARAGTEGIAISFCDVEEKAFITDIEKIIKMKIPVDRKQPYHSVKVEQAAEMSKGKAKAQIERGRGGGRGGPPRENHNKYRKLRKVFGNTKPRD
jgi:ATP-dependent RNA helicase RhlE